MSGECVVYIHNGILAALRKNEIMQCAATWIQIKDNLLSQVTQKNEDNT